MNYVVALSVLLALCSIFAIWVSFRLMRCLRTTVHSGLANLYLGLTQAEIRLSHCDELVQRKAKPDLEAAMEIYNDARREYFAATDSVATFTRLNEQILRGLDRVSTIREIICVFGSTPEERVYYGCCSIK